MNYLDCNAKEEESAEEKLLTVDAYDAICQRTLDQVRLSLLQALSFASSLLFLHMCLACLHHCVCVIS